MSTGARRHLGKYELVAQIGEGGMAEVHLARQLGPRRFEKLVVIKTIRPSLASRPEIAAMLLEEARIAALVKHPNVVDIYDLGEEDGTFFIAMEYLEGEALSAVLKESRGGTRLDPFSTARVIADCAAGLHAAHELHSLAGDPLELVHQDVTPGNVIVLYGGGVKLVDFGVARVRTSLDDGLLKGKTGYLAPELLDGAIADRRSDLWSLGVVLWESLTLRRLFYAPTEAEVLAKIRRGDIPAPSTLVPAVPRDLDDVVFKALARDPNQRYRTALAMQGELQEILRHASWSASSDPIARFMRGLFADRIQARRDLLRELATHRSARSATLERLQAIPFDSSPPPVTDVIGAHGSAPIRAIAVPPPPPESDLAVVDLVDDLEVADEPHAASERPVTHGDGAPAVAVLRRRRPAAIVAALGVLLVLGVALGMTLSRRASPAGAPDAGASEALALGGGHASPAGTPVDAAAEPAAVPPDAPGAEPAAAPADAAPAPVEPARPGEPHSGRPHHDSDRHAAPDLPPPAHTTPPPDGAAPPATAKTLYKEGLRSFVGGDVAGAIALFDKARAKDAGYAPTYRGLGMAYEKRGDKGKAIKAFTTYLKLAPDAADADAIRDRLEHLR